MTVRMGGLDCLECGARNVDRDNRDDELAALQSQIDRLTKERDEARDTARYWRDDVCQGTLKFPWEDKTDE